MNDVWKTVRWERVANTAQEEAKCCISVGSSTLIIYAYKQATQLNNENNDKPTNSVTS